MSLENIESWQMSFECHPVRDYLHWIINGGNIFHSRGRWNAIPYNMILHTQLQWLNWKIYQSLTHWGRVTHICVGDLTITGSDNGLLPGRCQAIIQTSAGKLLIGPLGTNFSEILIEILTFSFNKMCLKVSSAKWRPFCLGLNVFPRDLTQNLFYEDFVENW